MTVEEKTTTKVHKSQWLETASETTTSEYSYINFRGYRLSKYQFSIFGVTNRSKQNSAYRKGGHIDI